MCSYVCLLRKCASIIKGPYFFKYTFNLCTTLRFFAAAREPVAEEWVALCVATEVCVTLRRSVTGPVMTAFVSHHREADYAFWNWPLCFDLLVIWISRRPCWVKQQREEKIMTLALLNRDEKCNVGDVYVDSLKKAVNEKVRPARYQASACSRFLPGHMYLLTKPYLMHMSSSFLSCLIAPLSYCF